MVIMSKKNCSQNHEILFFVNGDFFYPSFYGVNKTIFFYANFMIGEVSAARSPSTKKTLFFF